MNGLKILYSFLLFILIITACSSIQSDRKYCSNEINLFSIQDPLKSISIDYTKEPDSIMSNIESILKKDLCWNMVYFGLELSNSKPVKVQLLKECEDSTLRCFRQFPEAQILLNQKGQLMIEYERTPIDSVKFWINKNFPNKVNNDLEEISIKWTVQTPKDSIEKTFENIIDGYLLNYSTLSLKLFSKDVCDLSKSQIDSLKVLLPFKLSLGMGSSIPPPPLIEKVEVIE